MIKHYSSVRPVPHSSATAATGARRTMSAGDGARRRRGGQAIVELALLMPVLAVMLVGVADLARVFYFSIAVYNAARAGVQYGTQSLGNSTDITGMVQAAVNDAPAVSNLTATANDFCQCGTTPVACNPTPSCSNLRRYVQVQTAATFTTLLRYPGVPSNVTLTGNAIMRAE